MTRRRQLAGSTRATKTSATVPRHLAGAVGQLSSLEVLDRGWPAFLDGAGIDATEPALTDRARALQVLRMLEQLATGNLTPDIARIVADRLHLTLA